MKFNRNPSLLHKTYYLTIPFVIDMKESKDGGPKLIEEAREYLNEKKYPIRIACSTKSGWPVVLSMWYVFRDGGFWCATQRKAKVIEYLRNDVRCAFEIAANKPPYKGVRGQGRAFLNEKRGKETLETLLIRYLGNVDSPLAKRLLAASEDEIAIEIRPINYFFWDYESRMKDSLTR